MVAFGGVAADPRGRATAAAGVVAHTSVAFQQRVRNRQPDGGFSGDGTSPLSRIRSLRCSASSFGAADISAAVYGWFGSVENRFGGAGFDDPAEVHHRDPVGDVPDHRQVVADEDVGDPQLLLQVVEQVEHLRLHRQVQRGDRLVADDDVGVSASARAMPMRCRCPPENSCGYLSAALAPRPTRSSSPRTRMSRSLRGLVQPLWLRHGSAMMSAAVIRAFSEAYGSWNTICTRRRNFSRSLPRRLNGSMPSNAHRARVGALQHQQCPCQRGLSAAGLADQAERLTARQVEGDAVERVQPVLARRWAPGTTCVRSRTSSRFSDC